MPKITIITLAFQYIVLTMLKTTEKYTFGYLDMIMHIMFILQSIAALGIMFLYVNSKSGVELRLEIKSIVAQLSNLVIFFAVMIIAFNIFRFYGLSYLTN